MAEYPFIAASLPDLQIGMSPEISFEEFIFLLRMNLSSEDFEKSQAIRRYYDMLNIRAFLAGERLDPYALYNEKELEEAIVSREGFPEYVYKYLDKYETTKEQLLQFPELLSMYFANEIKDATGFLKDFLIFERDLRRVTATLRAKRLDRDVAQELQYEDQTDPMIMQIVEENEIPDRYSDLKGIFEEYADEPMKLHKALYEYRFYMIDEICGIEQFTLKKVLGYLVQLILVLKWVGLDQTKGKQYIDHLIKGIT